MQAAGVRPACGARARRAAPPAARLRAGAPARRPARGRGGALRVAAHTVQLTHNGVTHTLSVSGDESILEVALDAGIDVPHDCKASATPRLLMGAAPAPGLRSCGGAAARCAPVSPWRAAARLLLVRLRSGLTRARHARAARWASA
jgi:hypothetical protein